MKLYKKGIFKFINKKSNKLQAYSFHAEFCCISVKGQRIIISSSFIFKKSLLYKKFCTFSTILERQKFFKKSVPIKSTILFCIITSPLTQLISFRQPAEAMISWNNNYYQEFISGKLFPILYVNISYYNYAITPNPT